MDNSPHNQREQAQTPGSHFLKNAMLSVSAGDKAERGVTLICQSMESGMSMLATVRISSHNYRILLTYPA